MSDAQTSVPVRGVVPLIQMAGDDEEDTKLLREMAAEAKRYLRCFSWCKKIRSSYFGDGYGGVIGVFLFHIDPSRQDIDEWLWVVMGDISPAYLVIDNAGTPSQALQCYIYLISKWIELAKQGRSSNDVISVYVPATPEYAAVAEARLKILQDIVIPAFQEAEAGKT